MTLVSALKNEKISNIKKTVSFGQCYDIPRVYNKSNNLKLDNGSLDQNARRVKLVKPSSTMHCHTEVKNNNEINTHEINRIRLTTVMEE